MQQSECLLCFVVDITVICPWEAFNHLELHELAQYGIIWASTAPLSGLALTTGRVRTICLRCRLPALSNRTLIQTSGEKWPKTRNKKGKTWENNPEKNKKKLLFIFYWILLLPLLLKCTCSCLGSQRSGRPALFLSAKYLSFTVPPSPPLFFSHVLISLFLGLKRSLDVSKLQTRGVGGLPFHVLPHSDLSSPGCRINKNTKPEFCRDWTSGHRSAMPSFPTALLALNMCN